MSVQGHDSNGPVCSNDDFPKARTSPGFGRPKSEVVEVVLGRNDSVLALLGHADVALAQAWTVRGVGWEEK